LTLTYAVQFDIAGISAEGRKALNALGIGRTADAFSIYVGLNSIE
jgi:hypothetical protein